MKIIYIAIKGIDTIGGIETYTRDVGRRLADQGHEVIVYTLKTQQHKKPFFHQGIKVIPLSAIKTKALAKLSLVLHASFHQFSISNVDIVHYHAIGPSIFSFMPRIIGRKTIVQSHGHEWSRAHWGWVAKVFFHFAETLSFRMANGFTAVSEGLTQFYRKKYKQPVTFIPNGVDEHKKLPADRILDFDVQPGKYILFLGRLSEEKGIHYLIDAYQALESGHGHKLVIVGTGSELSNYPLKLIEQANSDENIVFAGGARGDLWNEWFSHAAMFVLPSDTEGLPISLLEAMSFSQVCIASDISPCKEVLGDTGYLFKRSDPVDLQEKLQYVIDHPVEAGVKSQRAKQRVLDRYTWERTVEELVELYRSQIKTTHQKNDLDVYPNSAFKTPMSTSARTNNKNA